MSHNADDIVPAFLTRAQVAKLLGVGPSTVDRSRIPRTRLTENGRPMFLRSDVMAYMKSRRQGQAFPEEPVSAPEAVPEVPAGSSIYGPSERLAEGLMFGSIVTEVFYHNGKIIKVTRQRCETHIDGRE